MRLLRRRTIEAWDQAYEEMGAFAQRMANENARLQAELDQAEAELRALRGGVA
jgi:hypothetical protein